MRHRVKWHRGKVLSWGFGVEWGRRYVWDEAHGWWFEVRFARWVWTRDLDRGLS